MADSNLYDGFICHLIYCI